MVKITCFLSTCECKIDVQCSLVCLDSLRSSKIRIKSGYSGIQGERRKERRKGNYNLDPYPTFSNKALTTTWIHILIFKYSVNYNLDPDVLVQILIKPYGHFLFSYGLWLLFYSFFPLLFHDISKYVNESNPLLWNTDKKTF